MTNPIPPHGGLANADPDRPGEFNAGPGFMAREKGVPGDLPATHYTDAQRKAGLVVPPLPISIARQASALRRTDPTDPGAEPDPMSLGS